MSAIGDYIHLHAKRYVKYGNSELTEGWQQINSGAYQQVRQKLINRLPSSGMDRNQAIDLQKTMTAMFAPAGTKTPASQELYQMLLDEVDKEFGDMSSSIPTLISSTVTATGGINMSALTSALKSKYIKSTTNETHLVQTIVGRLQNVFRDVSALAQGGILTKSEANAIRKKGLEIWKQTSTLLNVAPKELKSVHRKISFSKEFMTELNILIKAVKMSGLIKQMLGFVGETGTAIAVSSIHNLALKTADQEIMDKFIGGGGIEAGVYSTGKTTSKRALDTSKLIDAFSTIELVKQKTDASKKLDKENEKTITDKMTGAKLAAQISEHSSQNKVDILISFDDSGQKTAGISVKNYDLSKPRPITLVSQTSLLRLLQDEDSELVNHFLNIIGHTGTEKSIIENRLTNHVKWTKESIKAIILLKALSGDQSNKLNQAEWLTVIDNSSGQVKVINIQQLITNITNNTAQLDQLDIKVNGEKFDNLTIKQPLVDMDKGPSRENARKRIAYYLFYVHAKKVYAAIPSKLI